MKIKTPTIIYYVSWRSYNNPHTKLSTSSSQYNQSSHTNIEEFCKSMHRSLPSCCPASTAQSLLKNSSEWIRITLPLTAQSSLETPMFVWCNQCITIVTTYSPSWPFTYLSTGSPLELTCTVVNYCICSVD